MMFSQHVAAINEDQKEQLRQPRKALVDQFAMSNRSRIVLTCCTKTDNSKGIDKTIYLE